MSDTRHRALVVVRGTVAETRAAALAWVGEGPDVLWVGDHGVERQGVRQRLGTACAAVVLDAHDGLDAEVLGQVHGFIWGGGLLVVRLPTGTSPGSEGLVVWPYARDDVGSRFQQRFEQLAKSFEIQDVPALTVSRKTEGTPEQAQVVEALAQVLNGPPGGRVALLSDRGRGKSSALGLASRHLAPDLRVVVTAGHVESIGELQRFALQRLHYATPAEIAFGSGTFDVILVDEAAQIPVPLLQQIVARHPAARIAFATTARGYEGTGRGFVLRFLEGLKQDGRPLRSLTLTEPIRWGAGDPLERLVFEALLLDAEPAPPGPALGALEAVELDRDALAANERQLRALFGLLVHAHYRTTPGDLHRLLDAPNLRLHALLQEGQVVAATLLALEGGLPAAVCADLARGRSRLRGHALAETLVVHGGLPEAGGLTMVRSVRIAVHPELRRLGLGQRLVDHVHATYAPDLFGTLFGATAELLRFRRDGGYQLVRVGASRGSRTGEPAAVMVRPVSARAQALVATLRGALARDLPTQLAWMGQGDLCLQPALEATLLAQLPDPTALSDAECAALAADYAFGPRTLEAVLVPLQRFLAGRELAHLSATDRRLLEAVIGGHGWHRAAGALSLPAAMRAMRRAVRGLVGESSGKTAEDR